MFKVNMVRIKRIRKIIVLLMTPILVSLNPFPSIMLHPNPSILTPSNLSTIPNPYPSSNPSKLTLIVYSTCLTSTNDRITNASPTIALTIRPSNRSMLVTLLTPNKINHYHHLQMKKMR
jgi:hypothetical protein